MTTMSTEAFAELACEPDPPVEELALGLAAEFGTVDPEAARRRLDALAQDVTRAQDRDDDALTALGSVLGGDHGYAGDTREYDHPDNSMLPAVLERRMGLPITLAVLYVGVATRADIPLAGVGLPGHFVAGAFRAGRPELIDPFHGGVRIAVPADVPGELVRPWGSHETALRMLNNLVGSYTKRGHVGAAIHAADLRLLLPVEPADLDRYTLEARSLRARLN